MSKPKWTPGPWLAGRGAQSDPFAIEGPAHTIAPVKNSRYCAADADLIAAAPTLYAALEALVEAYRAGDYDMGMAAEKNARDALKTARGE